MTAKKHDDQGTQNSGIYQRNMSTVKPKKYEQVTKCSQVTIYKCAHMQ